MQKEMYDLNNEETFPQNIQWLFHSSVGFSKSIKVWYQALDTVCTTRKAHFQTCKCKYAHTQTQMQASYKHSYITHLKGKAELSSNQFHWKRASVQS